jgi:AcrR family transcriptional regulator
MGRWEPGARERLERAALELFAERGFAATTVPAIAARAGLTTRTFFRHFADKREVLFASETELPALAERLVADAPAGLGPMAVVAHGLAAVAAGFDAPDSVAGVEGRREALRLRRAVVEADAGLRERELQKFAALAEAARRGFVRRGADALTAALAAEVAVGAFRVAVTRWLDQEGEHGGEPLAGVVADTLRALRTVAADGASPDFAPGAR